MILLSRLQAKYPGHVQALRVGGEATLAQIVRLVERAQMARAPIQAVADRISAKFVPFVLAASLLTWLCWYLAGESALCRNLPLCIFVHGSVYLQQSLDRKRVCMLLHRFP